MWGKNIMSDHVPTDPELLEAQRELLDSSSPHHKGITIDDIISLNVAKPNLTIKQGERLFGCSKQNIYLHLNKIGLTWSGITRKLKSFKENRADILALKQSVCLDNLTNENAKKSSNRDLAVTFGILYEKERLARDLDKGNTGNPEQININFDPTLIPGSGGTIQVQGRVEPDQIDVVRDEEE